MLAETVLYSHLVETPVSGVSLNPHRGRPPFPTRHEALLLDMPCLTHPRYGNMFGSPRPHSSESECRTILQEGSLSPHQSELNMRASAALFLSQALCTSRLLIEREWHIGLVSPPTDHEMDM